jgi:hypothetical protein
VKIGNDNKKSDKYYYDDEMNREIRSAVEEKSLARRNPKLEQRKSGDNRFTLSNARDKISLA